MLYKQKFHSHRVFDRYPSGRVGRHRIVKHQVVGVESSGQYASRFDVETVLATRRVRSRLAPGAWVVVDCWAAGSKALESEAQSGEPDFEYSMCGDSFRLFYRTNDSIVAVTEVVR